MAWPCDHAGCEPTYCNHTACSSECADRATPCPTGRSKRRAHPLVECPHCKAPADFPCMTVGRHPHRLERPHPSRLEVAA